MQRKLSDIQHILILGSGTLGLRTGLQSALSGFDTTIYDIQEEALNSARKVQDKISRGLLKEGKSFHLNQKSSRTYPQYAPNLLYIT